MKVFVFLFLFVILFNFSSSSYSQIPLSSNQAQPLSSMQNKEIIKVSTYTLFSVLDYFNYFTDRKFETMFNNIKRAWTQKNFEEFDRLLDSLGKNAMLVAILKEKSKNRKDRYLIRLPNDPKRIRFSQSTSPAKLQTQPDRPPSEKQPPEQEDVVVSCDCASPCVVCFCPGTCNVPYYLCLCFFDSSPGGIPGGGGGGFFCNMFRGGKPCALRPPDYMPKK
ncbi:MAG: hypothetical protein CH6_3795 [Candidatus Kapaibacterium sp.]|nr:MAG: hypothetical protein CH6_3795 [Candidatus Kapabacteria bacterium]